jgi:hypothetical protein
MSTTIEDVARVLGVSVRGVRLRVDALDGVLDAHLRQGENNRILFDGEGLAILRRLEELRQAASISIRQAASRIRQELEDNSTTPLRQTTSRSTSNLSTDAVARENALLREMLDELKRDRDHWRDLAERLQPALPAPKPRRRWLGWLWPVRGRSV